jgi:predicted SprT family Zn-dependent metalloprotease
MNALSELELKDAIGARCKELILEGCSKLSLQIKPLGLAFSKKGTVGGTAGWSKEEGKWLLDFNIELALENQDEYLSKICPHEVAHILDVWEKGVSSHHGTNWQMIMFILGVKPDRCHEMDVSETRQTVRYHHPRIHAYKCPTCGYVYHLTTKLHNKITPRNGRYCGVCTNKSPRLVYLGTDIKLTK